MTDSGSSSCCSSSTTSSSSSSEEADTDGDLSDLLHENKLPYFAYVKNETSKSLVYLYEVFDADCLFAKCYSNSGPVINYLLHHRPSYVASESNFTTSVAPTQTSNVEFMFSDIVNIPYHYHGKFRTAVIH